MKQFIKTHGTSILLSVFLSQAITAAGVMYYVSSDAFKESLSSTVQESVAAKEKEEIEKYRIARFADYKDAPDSVPGNARVYGSLTARFTLAEFSDLECPLGTPGVPRRQASSG